MKSKVKARLLKWGHSESMVNSMIEEHFEYANTYYNGVSKIADVISSL